MRGILFVLATSEKYGIVPVTYARLIHEKAGLERALLFRKIKGI